MNRTIRPQDIAEAGWLLDPAAFGHRLSNGHYQIPAWIDYVSRRVALAIARGGARILISVPPQHGKSNLISGWLPPWIQENNPSSMTGVVSYSATLAGRWVRFGRDAVNENRERLRIQMGKSAEDYWECRVPGRPPGYVRAMGITGSITGFGYDNLILDDLYASPEEAFSESHRAKIEDIYWSVLEGRLSERANVIGIMTRWHHDDLFGKLIRAGEYEEIRLPALAEDTDLLGREPGEALWPEKHSARKLSKRRDAMPVKIWLAQYQARPMLDQGGIFKAAWWHVVGARPALVTRRVRYWDPAASRSQKATNPDWAVGALMSVIRGSDTSADGRFCVEEIDRDRGTALELEKRVCTTAERDGKRVPIRIEEEPGSSGVAYVAHLQRLLAGWDVKPVKHGAGEDKASRAKPFAAQMEVGNVVWVDGPWLPDCRAEFLRFTGTRADDFDDQVDAVTGAFAELAGARRWPWQTLGDELRREDRSKWSRAGGRDGFDRGRFQQTLSRVGPSEPIGRSELLGGGGR